MVSSLVRRSGPMENYRVVLYTSEYLAQIPRVQRYLWGRNERLSAAYFDWKHVRNPYLPEPLVYLAVHGDQVVGMLGYIGALWEFGSPRQTKVLPLAGDLVIAPDHRRRGLLSRMAKADHEDLAGRGYAYLLSMAAMRVTLLNHLMTGWQKVGSLQPMDRADSAVRTPSRLQELVAKVPRADSMVRRIGGLATKMTAQSSRDSAPWFEASRLDKISPHLSAARAPRGPEMVKLKRRLANDGRIRHVFDEAYCAWRFQNPRNRYRFLFWDESELEGYLILQSNAFPTDAPVGILDWEASRDEIRRKLLRAAVESVKGRSLAIWSASTSDSERSSLEAAGFCQREPIAEDPQAAAVRCLNDDLPQHDWRLGDRHVLDMSNWDFRMIHSRAF